MALLVAKEINKDSVPTILFEDASPVSYRSPTNPLPPNISTSQLLQRARNLKHLSLVGELNHNKLMAYQVTCNMQLMHSCFWDNGSH